MVSRTPQGLGGHGGTEGCCCPLGEDGHIRASPAPLPPPPDSQGLAQTGFWMPPPGRPPPARRGSKLGAHHSLGLCAGPHSSPGRARCQQTAWPASPRAGCSEPCHTGRQCQSLSTACKAPRSWAGCSLAALVLGPRLPLGRSGGLAVEGTPRWPSVVGPRASSMEAVAELS